MLRGGSLTLHSGGLKQHCPTSGPNGYTTLDAWGPLNASQRGTKSELANKLAGWLHNPCRLGVPNALERGTKSPVAH